MSLSLLSVASYRKPAVTFIASAESSSMSSGILSLDIPVHQDGDIIVMFQGSQNSTPAPTATAAGFSSITTVANTANGSSRSLRLSYKFGNGSSETVSLTANGSSGSSYAGCLIFRYASGIGNSNTFSNTTTISPISSANIGTIPAVSLTNQLSLGAVVATTYFTAMVNPISMSVSNGMAYAMGPSTFGSTTYTPAAPLVNISAAVEII
jgi:hypothetical protein